MFSVRVFQNTRQKIFYRLTKCKGTPEHNVGRTFSTKGILQREKILSVRDLTAKQPLKKESYFKPEYLLFIFPISTFCLGTWQVQRRKWKINLIKELQEISTAAPVPFPKDVAELGNLEYRKVTIRGRFDHSRELYVMPRSPIGEGRAAGGGEGGLFSTKSKSGAQVITAFEMADTGMRVLINRGWVPRNKINPATRQEGQITNDVEIVAVVRKAEKRPPLGARNDLKNNHWMFKDSDAMAEVLSTQPIMLDADIDSTVPGGPLGGQTKVSLRNEHLSYIVTWYSLSILTAIGTYRTIFRK